MDKGTRVTVESELLTRSATGTIVRVHVNAEQRIVYSVRLDNGAWTVDVFADEITEIKR